MMGFLRRWLGTGPPPRLEDRAVQLLLDCMANDRPLDIGALAAGPVNWRLTVRKL